MSRSVLIAGATGRQGGAVIEALLTEHCDFTILAVTRDPEFTNAKRLAQKSPSIKLVKGDLDDVPALFEKARGASLNGIWGVFSVQAATMKNVAVEQAQETKQGIALVDEALKAGVSHFVYTSVDRGGEQRSWENPTNIPHFHTKHIIEQHLRDASAKTEMGWTVLRPVSFMDNLVPGFQHKVFLTALRDTMGDKPLPWIATTDIGFFAAEAFRDPATWNHKALSLAGDELNFRELNETFKRVTGQPAGTTYGFLGSALKWGVAELGAMIDWFRDEGYQADIPELRKLNPDMLDMETWLKEKSAFPKKP